jgi:hypothetical protein
MSSHSRTALRLLLALFFCVLTTAAVTRPLTRAKFRSAPDVRNVHEGLSRHTFLEVAAGDCEAAATYSFVAPVDLPSVPQRQQGNFKLISAHQAHNWPLTFSPVHRRIPPSKSIDPDSAV